MLAVPRTRILQFLPQATGLIMPWLVLATIWLGGRNAAWADEPKASPGAPQNKTLAPVEEARLDEAKKLHARVAELYGAGEFAEAIPLGEKVVEICKQVLGEKHPDYATSLGDLAYLYRAQGNYAKAEPLLVEALAIRKQALGEKHPGYATSLGNLAHLYQDQGDYAKAEPLYTEALAIRKQVLGEKHPGYATSLGQLAHLYQDQGKYAKAEPLLVDALAINKLVLGEKHPGYAQSLTNLAGLYQDQGNYAKAEPLLIEALAIRKQVLGEKHPDYATSLSNLAQLYQAQGNDAKAEPLLIEALAIHKQVVGEKHPAYATSLNNLAELYQNQGNFAKAEPLFVEALAINKQALGEKHPGFALSVTNLAGLYQAQGNYAKAEPHFVEALAINKQVLGEKHPDYAASLNNLAGLYQDQGNFAKAEPLYIEALAIRKQVLGVKHPDYATSLNNLAELYRDQGNYAKAEPLYAEARAIQKEVLGEKHPRYAMILNDLAVYYLTRGNYAKAEPLFVEALAIRKQAQGIKHPSYATGLNNLAALYHAQGNYAKAEPLLIEALAIDKQFSGEKRLGYARSLNNLAALYQAQGNYAKAEPLFIESLTINNQAQRELHPDYATSLDNLAACELGLRSFDAAAMHASQATEIIRRLLDLTFAIQSEHQQLLMVDKSRGMLDGFLSAGRAAKSSPESVYEQVLAWKGVVTGRQIFLRTLRRELANKPESAKLFSDLEAATRQLAVLTNLVPKEPEREADLKRLNELSNQVEDLQKRLAAVSAPFAEQRARQRRTCADLRQTLPADAALVDLIEYNHYGWTDESKDKPIWQRRVTAFVVLRDKPTAWIDLGLAGEINSAIETWRTTYGAGMEAQQAAETLRGKIWRPLGSYLAGTATVLISPDGALAKFPWGALPGSKPGKYLIEERAIAIIPVPQALAELVAKTSGDAPHPGSLPKGEGDKSASSLLLIGDVDYGADPGDIPRVVLSSSRGPRAVRDGQKSWDPLPATRTEILAIRDSFERRFTDGKVGQLREKQATVEAVRVAAADYRYLHFATHGFFADPAVRSVLAPSDKPELTMFRDELRRAVVSQHPGLLSGIVLAGANQPPAEGKDDGILTALEVGELDLHGVELVTLSACETGLGATAGGEGLLGLQRAFQTAGAHSTVATLWKVRDDAAQQLMSQMYENIWTKRMSKLEALRQAQLSILYNGLKRAGEQPGQATRGGVKLLPDAPANDQRRLPPYYWAAFVLSGDWR